MHLNFLMVGCGSVPPIRHGGIERVVDLYVKGLKCLGHTVSILYENKTFNEDYELTHNKFCLGGGPLIIQNRYQKKWLKDNQIGAGKSLIHLLHWRSPAVCEKVISPSIYCSILPILQFCKVASIPHPVYDMQDNEYDVENLDTGVSILSEYRLKVGEFFFIPARLCDFKNVRRVIQIAMSLDMIPVWAGPIEDQSLLDHFIKSGGIHIGNLKREEVTQLMKLSAAVLCVTRYFPVAEAFGLYQVEALLSGAKVISSRSGGLFDTAYHPNTYTLINSLPVKPFKRSLEKFLRQPVKQIDQTYALKYSNVNCASRLIEFIEC